MGNDLFGNLGGLGDILGGVAKNLVPKDTPEGKLLATKGEFADLQKQEKELLVEIGKIAYQQNPTAYPQHTKLQLIQENMAAVKAELAEAENQAKVAEEQKAAEEAKSVCPNCGVKNPDGVKFCQECGSPLALEKKHCTTCGVELAPGTRFCGSCGARQD